ncbi:MAG: hypothetical protein KC466_10395 [Myxococcales bacterium]|nr:hypothetical protein [Myxococcales bacterium]
MKIEARDSSVGTVVRLSGRLDVAASRESRRPNAILDFKRPDGPRSPGFKPEADVANPLRSKRAA